MFRRNKKNVARHQPLSASSAQSAHTAANHAFLNAQPAPSNLSSAAAAAALRSLTPTPTSVESVQTKRLLQRQSTISLQTSGPLTLRPGSSNGVRRMNSLGSMSSRTFRDQSPRRPNTSSGPVNAPPLPSMPPKIPAGKGFHHRSFSVEPTMRTTSTAKRPSGRGVSLDRNSAASSAHSPPRVMPVHAGSEVNAPLRRNSINFSYPITSRTSTPRQSPVPVDHGNKLPSTATAPQLPQIEILRIQNSVSQAANKPISKKPKVLAPGSAEGSHLAAATRGTPTSGAAPHSIENPPHIATGPSNAMAPQSSPQNTSSKSQLDVDKQPLKFPSLEQAITSVNLGPQIEPSILDDEHEFQSYSSRPLLAKRPSTVKEEYEEERTETGIETPTLNQSPVDDTRMKRSIKVAVDLPQLSSMEDSLAVNSPIMGGPSVGPLASTNRRRRSYQGVYHLSREGHEPTHMRHSSSPVRSARFSNRLSVTGDILHEPPPRSVSPAKSALKRSPTSSLSPERRSGYVTTQLHQAPSEISDVTSVASDEGSRQSQRRRHAKVSFDEETEVFGIASSPPTSPEDCLPASLPVQAKPKSHLFGISTKRDYPPGDVGEEFDEVFKPRPTLPSFGSIRRGRDTDYQLPPHAHVSDDSSSESDGIVDHLPQSSDRAIGNVLASTRLQGNTSEIRLDHSDRNSSIQDTRSSFIDKGAINESASGLSEECVADSSDKTKGLNLGSSTEQEVHGTPEPPAWVPVIAVQPASPQTENARPSLELYRPPGAFPSTSAASQNSDQEPTIGFKSKPELLSGTVGSFTGEQTDSDDESGGSVYSDAAEDWADIEEDVYGSLNAIVDGHTGTVGLALGTPSDRSKIIDDIFIPVERRPSDSLEVALRVSQDTTADTSSQRVSAEHAQKASATRPLARTAENLPAVALPSPDKPFAFSSPYPPLPLKPPAQAIIGGSNSAAKQTGKRPVSVVKYERAEVSKNQQIFPTINDSNVGQKTANRRPPTVPRRTASNDSDSSSSFKRSRRSSRSDGSFTMKRTMRSTGSNNVELSPPNERKLPRSDAALRTMATTLRNGLGKAATPRLDGNTSKFSFAKANGPHVSRFEDSDDELGADRPRFFQSRFADSSDEERPARSFRPVRGIPPRNGSYDGESTELEDSSEDPGSPGFSKSILTSGQGPGDTSALAAVARARGMTQAELIQFLNQPSERKKPRLFGLLGRSTKSKDADHRIRKSDLESPTRRDTHLERTRLERKQLRRGPASDEQRSRDEAEISLPMGNTHPSSPRLQRRLSNRATNLDSWPLRSQLPDTSTPKQIGGSMDGGASLSQQGHARSQTSDGVMPANGTSSNGNAKMPTRKLSKDSTAGRFQSNSTSAPDGTGIEQSASDVIIGRTASKKRFSMLRKAFRMKA